MIQAIFLFLINLIATLIQIILIVPNAIVSNMLPDFANWIAQITNGFIDLFNIMLWPISQLPDGVLLGLAGVALMVITLALIAGSVGLYKQVFEILQKIKFW